MKNDDWTTREIEEINLMYTPHTKALLINRARLNHEEYADYSEESLKAELLYLYRTDSLDELITAEWITSEDRLKAECEENLD